MSDAIRKALQRDSNCPELSELFEAMNQDTLDPRRLRAEQHMKSCPGCQTEWALFRQFEAGEVRPDERSHVDYIEQQLKSKRAAERRTQNAPEFRSFWQRFWTPAWMGGFAVAMAALLMTIGLTSQWRTRHSLSGPSEDHQTLRSQSLEILTPLHGLTQPPAEISWKPVEGAATYAITLTEVDGTRIFYTKVTSSSLSLPSNARTLLAQGKLLQLVVTAFDASAREIAHSPIARMQVSLDGASPR